MKREDIKEMLDCIMTLGLEGDEAIDYIDGMIKECDGWISVDDRLPEIGQECLIEIPVCGKFNLENGKYKGKGIWVGAWCDFRGKGCNYKVNRWMPLPSVE